MKRKLSLGALLLVFADAFLLPQTAQAAVPVTTNAIPDHADWGYVIQGGTLGGDIVYVYTNQNDSTMTWTVPTGVSTFRAFVVAGGGAGGATASAPDNFGGGGGGGGVVDAIIDKGFSSGTCFNIKVGAGGASAETNGGNSYIKDSTTTVIESVGGGAGMEPSGHGATEGKAGNAGGSGGGAGGAAKLNATANGGGVLSATVSASYVSSSSQYGRSGGSSSAHERTSDTTKYNCGGGGGGGANENGGNATVDGSASTGGKGGDGISCDITGEIKYYAGGGGGSGGSGEDASSGGGGGAGGLGGGGVGGARNASTHPTAGTDGLGGGGSCYNAKSAGAAGGSGVVIIRYSLMYYWCKDEGTCYWADNTRWYDNVGRTGSPRSSYPDSADARVCVGWSDSTVSQTIGFRGETFDVGDLTMAGGTVELNNGSLRFPSLGDASSSIVQNNSGTLIFHQLGLSGDGEIRGAAGTTNEFRRVPIEAGNDISYSAAGLTGSESATFNVLSGSKSTHVPENLYSLKTGGSASSTLNLAISNTVVNLSSATALSGSGKIAMNFFLGDHNATNQTTAPLSAPSGSMTFASGSTLRMNVSQLTVADTYQILSAQTLNNPGNLTVSSVTVAGGTTWTVAKTLSALAVPAVKDANGKRYELALVGGNTLALTIKDIYEVNAAGRADGEHALVEVSGVTNPDLYVVSALAVGTVRFPVEMTLTELAVTPYVTSVNGRQYTLAVSDGWLKLSVVTYAPMPGHADWGYVITNLPSAGGGVDTAYVYTNTTAAMKWTAPVGVTAYDFLVVGGGGAGGSDCGGGGGGGGVVTGRVSSVTAGTSYAISVGAGCAGAIKTATVAANGGDSKLVVGSSEIVAAGGGSGGRYPDSKQGHADSVRNGCNGGSGGGAYGSTGTAGTSTQTTTFTIPNVVAGGFGNAGSPSSAQGSGGGGASEAGHGMIGGEGVTNDITGLNVVYGSGGGGGTSKGTTRSAGGTNAGAGGVNINNATSLSGGNGVPLTGGGGGGRGGGFDTADGPSGSGGSGVVVIRYAGAPVVKIPSLTEISHEYTGENLRSDVVVDPLYASVAYSNGGDWTECGTYTATCTLNDPANAQWADGTTTPKVLYFVVTHPVDTAQYREVGYVQTTKTGGQYVDTGILAQNNIRAEMRVWWLEFPAKSKSAYLLGASASNNRQYLFYVYNDNNTQRWKGGCGSSTYVLRNAGTPATAADYRLTARFGDNGVSNQTYTVKKGTDAAKSDYADLPNFDPTKGSCSLGLLCLHSDASYVNAAYARLAGCSIYTNDLQYLGETYATALAREYVPVYDSASGKFGLFDKVTGVFNPSGKADFVGPAVYQVNLSETSKAYDGTPVDIPSLTTVKDSFGNVVPVSDYTLSYARFGVATDDFTSEGVICVTATGTGCHTGTASAYYTIGAPLTMTEYYWKKNLSMGEWDDDASVRWYKDDTRATEWTAGTYPNAATDRATLGYSTSKETQTNVAAEVSVGQIVMAGGTVDLRYGRFSASSVGDRALVKNNKGTLFVNHSRFLSGTGYYDLTGGTTKFGGSDNADTVGIRVGGTTTLGFYPSVEDDATSTFGYLANETGTATINVSNAVVKFTSTSVPSRSYMTTIKVVLGSNNLRNDYDTAPLQFAGALTLNNAATLKVDASAIEAYGHYPLVVAGTLSGSCSGSVSIKSDKLPSDASYAVVRGKNSYVLTVVPPDYTVYTWVGPEGGSWTNAYNWSLGDGAGNDLGTGYWYPNSSTYTAKFTNGTYRVITEYDLHSYWYIKELLVDDLVNVTFVNKTCDDYGLIRVYKTDPGYAGVITLVSTEEAAWTTDSYSATFASGVWLGKGIPRINKELHVVDHRFKLPTDGALGFGADNALMTFTGSKFGQTGGKGYVSFLNDDNERPVRLAFTNTTWMSEFASSNALGIAATVTIAGHSDIRMGMVADRFGGAFSIDDSLAAFNNVGPGEDYYGDTVALMGLNVSGEGSKFVLSGNATLASGELHFTMPTGGFTNDVDNIANSQVGGTFTGDLAVTNLDVAFAGVAPVAIIKDFDLCGATVTVDASAMTDATKTYPLVRVGDGYALTTPAASAMRVTGGPAGYVGIVEPTLASDGTTTNGLDLAFEQADLSTVTWTAEHGYTNFWYTAIDGTWPTLIGTTPGGYRLVEGTDYTMTVYTSKGSKAQHPLTVGNDVCRVEGKGRFSGTTNVVPFTVARQTYTWTSDCGTGGVGTWEGGAWVTNTLPDVGNENDRLSFPTGVADVYLRPAANATASITLGGTASQPREVHELRALGYYDGDKKKTTTWLRDGYLKLGAASGAGGSGETTASGSTLAFSNVVLQASKSPLDLSIYNYRFSLVFAGTNALIGVCPCFNASSSSKVLRFENGATTIDSKIGFGTTAYNTLQVSNATVVVKDLDSHENKSSAFAIAFTLGNLNVPNASVTDFTPMLAVTNVFDLGVSSAYTGSFYRAATIDARAKTTKGETFDILTVPTEFDLYAPIKTTTGSEEYTPFAPATLSNNTTCAAGLVPQITAVTNDTLQTVRLTIKRDISAAEFTIDPTAFTYNGQEQGPTVTATWGGETLTQDVDFTVVDGRKTDAGFYKLKLQGIGDYAGETTNQLWKITCASYTWKGPDGGDWNNPENWTPPDGLSGTYPDSVNKTVWFSNDAVVNVNVTESISTLGVAIYRKLTLRGPGKITLGTEIGISNQERLRLEGDRLGFAKGLLRLWKDGTAVTFVGDDAWPFKVGVSLAMPTIDLESCTIATNSWSKIADIANRARLRATNTTFTVTADFAQIGNCGFTLIDSAVTLTAATAAADEFVSLDASTLTLANTPAATFTNVTVKGATSRLSMSGDYAPGTDSTWSFVVPSTGYDAAPIQANNITIPSSLTQAIDLSSVSAAGTYRLATATAALSIDGGLEGLETNTAYTQTGLVANLVLVDGGKTLAVEVKRDLTVCTATVKSPETIEYTGSDLTSKIKFDVTGTFGGAAVTLIEGTDYDITLTNAVGREESSTTYVATITGKGGCVGTIEAEYTILGRVFVWAGGNEGNWRNEVNWDRTGSGTGHGWPGDDTTTAVMYKYDIIVFTNGNYKVVVDLPKADYWYRLGIVGAKSMSIASDANVDFIMGDGEYGNVEVEECCDISSVVRIVGHATRPFPMTIGGHAYYKEYPRLSNELHLEDLKQCPWGSAIWLDGTTKAVLSMTGCVIGQGTTDKNKAEFITFYCENDNLPVVIAMTNTIWRTTCGPRDANTVGRNATWSYCNSTNLTGIIANHFGGALTLDNSVVGFQNLHDTDAAASNRFSAVEGVAEGDTFQATSLAISGANTKFALSENAKVSGSVAFTMPADGFTNDVSALNFHDGANVDFNIDTTFAGVAPFAVATNLDLSAATLTVDATAVGSTPGVYPLVRVGEAGTLTLPTAAMTVSGVAASGYIGWVKTTADGKGLDLIVEVASVDNVIWTAENNYTNFWYTGKAGTYPTLIGTTPEGYILVPGTDYSWVVAQGTTQKDMSKALTVGDYHCRVSGMGRFYRTEPSYVVPFHVVRQSYTWTSSSGSDGVGDWLTGVWEKNVRADIGNEGDRLDYPTGVASVYLKPDVGSVASITLGGTAETPRGAYELFAVNKGSTGGTMTTTWLRDGYLKLSSQSCAPLQTSGMTSYDYNLAFSNVTLLANSTVKLRLRYADFGLTFAGTNALADNVLPEFQKSGAKTLRFENGLTTLGYGMSFGTDCSSCLLEVTNASVCMASFDSSVESVSSFDFKFMLGDLNRPNTSDTDFTPMLAVTNTFNIGSSAGISSRNATINAKAKTTRGETFDILTVPTSFDLYAEYAGVAPFAPATLAANTTCAAGYTNEITVVTNAVAGLQTVRLRMLEQLASVELETPSVPYTGTNVVPVVKKVTTVAGNELTDPTIGWTVTYWRNGVETPDLHTPGTVTVKVTGTGDLSGEVTTSFVIRGHYEVVDAEAGVTVQVSQTWADEAYGNGGTGPAVQTKLETANAYGIKGWEAYALGFAAGQAANAAAVVQPVQTATPDQLTLKLGDWPTTKPSDSGVTVKYQLHNAQTVGAAFSVLQDDHETPQFDIPLSGWESNVQYYRIRSVFTNK